MSTVLGTTLPAPLRARLSGEPGATPADTAVALATVDDDGFPHPALLTYREIEAAGPQELRLSVAGASRTAANLRRGGTATLSFIDEEGVWYVKASVDGTAAAGSASGRTVVFPLRIVQVLADAVDAAREPQAAIVSGIRFRRSGTEPPA